MSCILKPVPWANKAEWESVYDDAYCEDPERLARAWEMMQAWRQRREDCAPAIECTQSLIGVMLKDRQMNPKVQQDYADNDLVLLYSAAVMRLINLISTSGKKDKMTLKQIAGVIKIPEWIVTLRNDIAHGATTAGIDVLRSAASFLKNWLKEHYWEVEKAETEDWFIEKPRGLIVEERVRALIKIYVHLKKYCLRNYHCVSLIEDPQVRDEICGMSRLRSNVTLAEILPWEHQVSLKEHVHPKEIELLSPTKAWKLALTYLRPYLKQDFWYINTARILVDCIIEENIDDCSLKKSVWDSLIECVHQWGNLGRLMEALSRKAVEDILDEAQRVASAWLLELTLASRKRHLCDCLKLHLSRLSSHIVSTEDVDEHSVEGRLIKRLLLKRRLNMDSNKSSSTIEELMKRIEKKLPHFRNVIRLMESRSADVRWHDVNTMITNLVEKPNRHVVQCIRPLTDLLYPRMKKHDVTNVCYLVKLYTGLAVLPSSRTNRIYTIDDLARFNKDQQQKRKPRQQQLKELHEEEAEESEVFSAAKKFRYDSVVDTIIDDRPNDEDTHSS